jgi:hypothetical protein
MLYRYIHRYVLEFWLPLQECYRTRKCEREESIQEKSIIIRVKVWAQGGLSYIFLLFDNDTHQTHTKLLSSQSNSKSVTKNKFHQYTHTKYHFFVRCEVLCKIWHLEPVDILVSKKSSKWNVGHVLAVCHFYHTLVQQTTNQNFTKNLPHTLHCNNFVLSFWPASKWKGSLS